ncbi:hypothetical protein E4T42_08096 [Aureobasidium subglaciale]|nr:hypothetical protein E4T42_08096 [Aureobasidium subglaciale]
MANRRSFRHEIISAVAKLPWHTNRCCSPICNEMVGQRSWVACPTHLWLVRPRYMCTAATIEYSLSLGIWHHRQPLLITGQLVCNCQGD